MKKRRREEDTSGNESSHQEEAVVENVASHQVRIHKKKTSMKHKVESKSDDAQTKRRDGDSPCSASQVAGDSGKHRRNHKHGKRKEYTSPREEETNVTQYRDVAGSSRSDAESEQVIKKEKTISNADDDLTPTWQQEEGPLQSAQEEETAKSESKSGRKKKRTAADGGSNIQDIEPPPAQDRPRKKRKHREMSDAVPDGTFRSGSYTVESHVNPDQSSNSNRKKKKKKKKMDSCQSEDYQGGGIEEMTADTRRHKERRKQKKGNDLEKDLPSEPLPSENSVTSRHRQRRSKAERTVPRTEEADELYNEMGDDEEAQHVENYDSQVQFMSKFIRGFARKSQMRIITSLKYDYHRFKQFEKKGIQVRFGRFTKEELEQLEMNVNDFIRDYDSFTDPRKLFLPTHYPEEKKLITQYRLQNNFYNYLVRGISRPVNQIFHRGMTLYEGQGLKSGRYSDEELKQLIQLTREFGPHWKHISQIMQRGQKNLSVKFGLLSNGLAKGIWSDGEAESLLQAMKDYLQAQMRQKGVDQLDTNSEETIRVLHGFLYSDVPWTQIATRVDKRNSHQCRKKWYQCMVHLYGAYYNPQNTRPWFTILSNRLKKITPLIYGWQGDTSRIQLIQSLYNMEVEDSADIDWDEIGLKMKMPPWLLQKKFYQLKVCHVPKWKNKTFGEIIDVLHDVHLPRLLKKRDEAQPAGSEVEPTEILLKGILNGTD